MKYRKKPIIIEAYQTDVELDIETLEGVIHANVGDYIITGINGEKYPCKPDIFEKTYELVKENNYNINKELDALQEVRQQLIYYKEYAKEKLPTKAEQINAACEEELNLIETTLRDYKRVMAEKNDLFKRWAKEHQALEIFKEKRVNIFVLMESKNVNVYNYHLKTHRFQFEKYLLTQEEYDILKEVLL